MVPITSFQFLPVLHHINIFQTVVIGIDIMVCASFPYVKHSHVFPIDINDCGAPCLPVQVYMLGHRTLNDGITHEQMVEVITGISQQNGLELIKSRLLVWKEFILKLFLAEPLVCIENERFQRSFPGSTSHNTDFTELVYCTSHSVAIKQLYLGRTPPIIFIVRFFIIICSTHINTYLRVI